MKSAKDKMKDKAGEIILPERNGVADLEIRRMQNELGEKPRSSEMRGHMPVELIGEVVKELKETIEAIERGEVTSVCLISIRPGSGILEAGHCFFGAKGDDLMKIDELFHMSLAERLGDVPPDDEAG